MDSTPRQALFPPPILPSDLVQFIINRCTYPTVLLVCSSRADFLSALTQDFVSRQQHQHEQLRQHRRRSRRRHQQSPPPATEEATSPPAQPPVAGLSHLRHVVREEEVGDGVDAEAYMNDGNDDDNEDEAEPSISLHSSSSSSRDSSRDSSPHRPPHPHPPSHPLLTPTLAQLSATRHIRTVFVPTVSHLRAFLSVFSVVVDNHQAAAAASSTLPSRKPPPPPTQRLHPPPPPPPPHPDVKHGNKPVSQEEAPLLLVYGFLRLHRDTSEWSAQGVGASAAGLVEAAARTGLRAVVVEGQQQHQTPQGQKSGGGDGDEPAAVVGMDKLLAEKVPILSGGDAKRIGGELGRKTVEVRMVLGRWFRLGDRAWWDGEEALRA
ncbi:hypothetical protein VTJ83DRAFT_4574 [Remersonia thermophila]|uniref:Uncharacterized protein n=1 Tax=Remersonia thermophila TaxID=72144 RepID=A0ABR4DAJ8_9PEZI